MAGWSMRLAPFMPIGIQFFKDFGNPTLEWVDWFWGGGGFDTDEDLSERGRLGWEDGG